mgnify:CR=1 FL=1
MRDWMRTLLFLSAFSPALITMAYVRYDIHGWRLDVLQLLIIGLIGTALPLAIVKLVKLQGESFAIHAKKIESSDFMLLAFVGSYLLPLVLKASEVSVNAIVVVLAGIAIVLWLIGSLPTHPLLRFMRFRFYKVESSSGVVYTLIAKRDIRDPKDVKLVKKISGAMLMEDDGGV